MDATGAELDECQIICDIRPIFDEGRDHVEGAIPLTTLRLEFSNPDGESQVVEMRLTEKQLQDLLKKFAIAQRKLNAIKALLHTQAVTIPKTKSTIAEVS